MAYNSDKDKLIKLYEMGDENNALQIAIFSYNEGEPKLQMTRRFLKKDETMGYGKVGRLSLSEMKYLQTNMDEILKYMEK